MIKLTSKSLGLPTRDFSRDLVSDPNKLDESALNLLISKQELLLKTMKNSLPDKGIKLQKSINAAKEVLEKRSKLASSLSDDLLSLSISDDKYPVCGKRQMVPLNVPRNQTPTKSMPIISYAEEKRIVECSLIKVHDGMHDIIDKSIYRNPIKFDDLDSDDSDLDVLVSQVDSDDD